MSGVKHFMEWLKQSLWNDKRIVIFMIFVLLSAGFWFLNALRRDYISIIPYPVKFVNLPQNKILSGEVPEAIDLKVRGTGFSLLRYHFSNQLIPYAIDVSKMRRLYDGSVKGAYLVTHDYTNRISGQLSNDIELLEMTPDTIYISFYNKTSRMIPVRLNASISFVQQYNQTGSEKFTPDSIMVSGPNYLVDTLSGVYTEFIQLSKVADTLFQTVDLTVLPDLTFSQQRVNMMIPVEAFTESSIDVPIGVKDVPADLILKTFPAEVRVSFRVGISQFEHVKAEDFSAWVDLTNVDLSTQNRLKVRLDKIPGYVYSVDYKPLFVDFIIEKAY
jgi:hypothetical protein